MKATPITAKASALKQTYNPDLVAGAYNSAKKFQDHLRLSKKGCGHKPIKKK